MSQRRPCHQGTAPLTQGAVLVDWATKTGMKYVHLPIVSCVPFGIPVRDGRTNILPDVATERGGGVIGHMTCQQEQRTRRGHPLPYEMAHRHLLQSGGGMHDDR